MISPVCLRCIRRRVAACFAFVVLLVEGDESSGHIISLLIPSSLTCTGWQTPETALIDSHKLLRSIVLLLMGSDVLSIKKAAVETPFLDYGEFEEESKALWE